MGTCMKKLTNSEMKRVNGGAVVLEDRCYDTCSGIHKSLHKRHDVLIEGTGATRRAAKIAYNDKLERHKTSLTYRDYNHSARPVAL